MVSMLLKTLAVLVAEDFTINLQNIKFLNENRERTKFKLVRVISALSLYLVCTLIINVNVEIREKFLSRLITN